MGSSLLGHYVRFEEARLAFGDFVDTGIARRALNNLNHLADQRGQILVNWAGAPASYGDGFVGAYATSVAASTYYEIWRSTTFDLSVREDGSSYRCRTRANVTSNTGLYAAAFRTVLSWIGQDDAVERERNLQNVGEVAVTSASYSWEQPNDLLYLTADQVRRARAAASVINSVGGAEVSGIRLRARVSVHASVVNVAATARIKGLHLAEFYGA